MFTQPNVELADASTHAGGHDAFPSHAGPPAHRTQRRGAVQLSGGREPQPNQPAPAPQSLFSLAATWHAVCGGTTTACSARLSSHHHHLLPPPLPPHEKSCGERDDSVQYSPISLQPFLRWCCNGGQADEVIRRNDGDAACYGPILSYLTLRCCSPSFSFFLVPSPADFGTYLPTPTDPIPCRIPMCKQHTRAGVELPVSGFGCCEAVPIRSPLWFMDPMTVTSCLCYCCCRR